MSHKMKAEHLRLDLNNQSTRYKYKLRPGFKSNELLLEFFSGVELDTFFGDLHAAIAEIEPLIVASEDIFVNDEIRYFYHSKIGNFMLYKDIWNFAFILSKDNQKSILLLDAMLSKNPKFEKIQAII